MDNIYHSDHMTSNERERLRRTRTKIILYGNKQNAGDTECKTFVWHVQCSWLVVCSVVPRSRLSHMRTILLFLVALMQSTTETMFSYSFDQFAIPIWARRSLADSDHLNFFQSVRSICFYNFYLRDRNFYRPLIVSPENHNLLVNAMEERERRVRTPSMPLGTCRGEWALI